MLRIQKYVKPDNLEEAYALLQKNRNCQILGGMMWLKMQDRMISTGIDLGGCKLDQIIETKDRFIIQAMVTLREVECHEGLKQAFHGMLQAALKDIVGVQFRNMATMGGSIYSRFGFSDVCCVLLALDCKVHLLKGGEITLQEFLNTSYDRDILTHITICKEPLQGIFYCMRKSATDISVLNMAVVKTASTWRISVGARPKVACLQQFDTALSWQIISDKVLANILVEDNMRAKGVYRQHLCKAFLHKAEKEWKEGVYADSDPCEWETI